MKPEGYTYKVITLADSPKPAPTLWQLEFVGRADLNISCQAIPLEKLKVWSILLKQAPLQYHPRHYIA